MAGRTDDLTPRCWRIVAVIVFVAAGGDVGRAADPSRTPGGGLVPTPRKTREELVREWDLNSDGKIDKGEVEVASSRMRRERAELRLNSGIDPVTGLPRGEAAGMTMMDPGDIDAAVEPTVPEDEPAEEPDRDERPALPGTRVPRPASPRVPTDPKTDGARRTAADGTRAAAGLKRQAVTGGVKAGGLPARAGYGAGVPATPLNAGLPAPPRARAATAPAAAQARGGLVPTPRAPAPATRPPARSRDLYDPY